jgi:hypothetical protein
MSGTTRRRSAALVLFALMVVIPSACGGDSTATSSSDRSHYPPGPTREFVIPGGDNVVQVFGREGSRAERDEASKVIAAWMRARVARDWAKDCAHLSRAYIKNIVADARHTSEGKATTCPTALDFFGPLASGKRVYTLSGPIDSLRVGEGRGYAQYHGREGIDWVVPMEKEGGHWKVAIAAPINRRR